MTATTAVLDPFDPIFVFIDEIGGRVRQCERWFDQIEAAGAEHVMLSGRREAGDDSVVNQVIAAQGRFEETVEAFLFQAARLSLLIFPVVPGRKDLREERRRRRERVRALLNLTEAPALESRALRDAFMHMDERLDAAVAEHGGAIARQYFEARPNPMAPRARVVRAFDTLGLRVRILGVEFELRPIRAAVAIVAERLEAVELRRREAERALGGRGGRP